MKLRSLILATILVGPAAPARAAVTFEFLFNGGYPLSVSYDGTAIAGNNQFDYGAFRWTAATGRVELGRASAPVVGTSGGTATISADGTVVASTIHSDDSTFVTAGVWRLGQGWQQIAPPVPPDGGIMDASLADVWGLSGDGLATIGLYWRPGYYQASAHAFRWTQAGGMVDLGATAHSSRPNGASYDGSVIAGWDEHPQYGYRRPCAWRGTTLYQLGDYDALGEATAVSTTGDWIVGFERNPATDLREAARWHWNGSAWSATEYLGAVPGSFPGYGLAAAKAVSADGQLVIGYSSPYGDPFYTTGFIWTDSTGCVDMEFWLADHDIYMDPDFDMQSMTCMTPDGQMLIGYGSTISQPVTRRAFAVQIDRVYLAVEASVAKPVTRVLASPNPMRSGTRFAFALDRADHAELTVHDLTGRLVRRVLDGALEAGTHRVGWDRRDETGARVAAGLYFIRLEAGGTQASGRISVLD